MVIFYFIIFFGLISVAWFDGTKIIRKTTTNRIYIFFLILFIIYASFKDVNSVKDANTYIHALRGEEFILEPSFHVIAFIVNTFLGAQPIFLFLIYSLIAIPIKGKAILKISYLPIFSLLIWFSDLYLVQELTQIRVGIAGGIFLLSLPSLYQRKFKKYIFFTLAATFFHVSAILMLFLWFVSSKKINSIAWIFVSLLTFVWALLRIDLFGFIKYIPIEGLVFKYEAYTRLMEETEQPIFSPLVIAKFVIILFMISRIQLMQKHNKYVILMLKIMFISIMARSLFATNTSVAFRISEFFGVIEITLIPCIYYVVKHHVMKYGLICFVAFAFMFIRIFSNKLIG